AQARARVVVGYAAFPACAHRLHPTNVHQEGHELPAAGGQLLDPRQDRRIIAKKLRVIPPKHSGTRSGWGNDVVIALKCVEHLQSDGLRRSSVTRIVGRLAAASLSPGDLDRAARLLEQFDCGKADRRPKQIDQTCHKQRYSHRRLAVLDWLPVSVVRNLRGLRPANQPALKVASLICYS